MSGLSDEDREALHQVYADDRFFDDYVTAAEAIVARHVTAALADVFAIDHIYDGACPDLGQPDARDPDHCPACARLATRT